jgi:hypothetical protein
LPLIRKTDRFTPVLPQARTRQGHHIQGSPQAPELPTYVRLPALRAGRQAIPVHTAGLATAAQAIAGTARPVIAGPIIHLPAIAGPVTVTLHPAGRAHPVIADPATVTLHPAGRIAAILRPAGRAVVIHHPAGRVLPIRDQAVHPIVVLAALAATQVHHHAAVLPIQVPEEGKIYLGGPESKYLIHRIYLT